MADDRTITLRDAVRTWPQVRKPYGFFDKGIDPTDFAVGDEAYLVEDSYGHIGRRVEVVKKTRAGVTVASKANSKNVVSVTTRSRRYKLFPVDERLLRYEASVRNSTLAWRVSAALEGCRGWSAQSGLVVPDEVAVALQQLADAILASAPPPEGV